MPDGMPFAGTTQNNLLKLLLRAPEPLSIQQIADGLNVTKTAARQHIQALEGRHYVEKSSVAQGRGRPVFSYKLSPAGRELFTRQYALFSEKVIESLKLTLGDEGFKKQMRAIGDGIAEDLQHKMPPREKRAQPDARSLARLAEIMHDLGYDTEEVRGDEVIAHNCVYHHLAAEHNEVCELDIALMEKLTGKKPTHTECMVRGGKSCRFKF